MRILKQSHSAKKCEKGPFGIFLASILLQNIKKYPLETFKKIQQKSLPVPKNRKGPLVSTGFVCCVEKGNKPGPAQVGAISKAQK